MSRRQWFVMRKHGFAPGSDPVGYPGYPDGSAQFDAGTGYLTLAGGLPLTPSQGFTVVWWCTQDVAGAADNEFVWGQLTDESGAAGDQVRFAFENGLGVYRNNFWASDGSSASNGDAGSLFHTWKMIAAVYDPSTFPPNPTVRQSVNALPYASSTSMAALLRAAGNNTAFWVGQGPAAGGWSYFRGRVDALSVWGGPLSIGEVTTLYNSGAGYDLPRQVPGGSISQPLLAWYPLDEPAGSLVWQDASGNHRDLIATGTVNQGGPRNT